MTIPTIRDCESEAKHSSRLVALGSVPTTRPRTLGRAHAAAADGSTSIEIRSQDATSNSSKLSRCDGVQPWQRLLPPRV